MGPVVVVKIGVDGGDWAEVVVLGEVVYRGHEDEAMEYAVKVMGAELVYDEPVTGKRVHVPVEEVIERLSV